MSSSVQILTILIKEYLSGPLTRNIIRMTTGIDLLYVPNSFQIWGKKERELDSVYSIDCDTKEPREYSVWSDIHLQSVVTGKIKLAVFGAFLCVICWHYIESLARKVLTFVFCLLTISSFTRDYPHCWLSNGNCQPWSHVHTTNNNKNRLNGSYF